jgi:hypothetical protein
MKKTVVLACALAATLLFVGCSDESAPLLGTTETNPELVRPPQAGLKPGGYYSFASAFLPYSELELIDTKKGNGTYTWTLDIEVVGDGIFSLGWIPFGLAFDTDGTMYVTQNVISFDATEVRSRLARVDSETGEVTVIGDPVPFNTSGPDIDANGVMYVCGFQVDALGYIFGNSSLWRVDKATGEFIEVGDTGHTNWMDLAFHPNGSLWGTFDNELYTIDPQTGASTFVTHIDGVPNDNPVDRMEVMSIAFDKDGNLFGTAMTVYYQDPDGSPVLEINVHTGHTEVVGYTHQGYNHGGDILLVNGDVD